MHFNDIQVGLGGGDEGAQLALILAADILEGEDGSGLLVDDGAEAGLALNDDVGDTHLAAERGDEDDELNRVDVVRDDDEGRLLGLDEGDTVVETVLDKERLLGVLGLGALRSLLRGGIKTSLLLLLRLGAVLVQQLEKLGRGVLVERVRELSDRGGHLKALVEDDLLALEAHILRPLHEAREVSLGTDVLAYALPSDYGTADTHIPDAPIPKFLGRDSKRGFFWVLVPLREPGAGATFLPVVLGGWSLRRASSAIRTTAQRQVLVRCTRSSNARTRLSEYGPSAASPHRSQVSSAEARTDVLADAVFLV